MPEAESGMLFPYKIVIWDWNGTLLNDIDHCVATINILLKERGLPLLTNGRYKEVFSFPVKDYYQKAGFDFSKEDFAVPARQFIERYNQGVNTCQLHKPVKAILQSFQEKNIRQFVLSAMKQDMLIKTLTYHKIIDIFEQVAGLDDHYAVSKIDQGKRLIQEAGINKENTCMIGDTLHDFEVAQELGISCILVADGHQSKQRLETAGVDVLDSLEDLMNIG